MKTTKDELIRNSSYKLIIAEGLVKAFRQSYVLGFGNSQNKYTITVLGILGREMIRAADQLLMLLQDGRPHLTGRSFV